MASKVDAATIVVAALREQVAALHAAADPAGRLRLPGTTEGEQAAVTGVDSVDGRDTGDVGGAAEVEGEVALGEADQRLALRDAVVGLEALLGGFAPLLDPAATDPLRDDLAWAHGVLDPLVEADAAHDLVEDLLDDLDPTLVVGPITTRLALADRDREQGAAGAVVELLASPRFSSILERADRLVIDAPLVGKAGKGAKSVLVGLLAEQDGQMAEALGALDHATDAVSLAADRDRAVAAGLRVAGLADAARVVHGKHARNLAQVSRAVVVAAHDDTVATAGERLLVDLADRAFRAGEPGFSYGLLHAAAGRRHQDALVELADAEAAWSKPKRHKWLHD